MNQLIKLTLALVAGYGISCSAIAIDFEYYQNWDGENTITLTRPVPSTVTELVIPGHYNGMTVTRIGESFLENCTSVRSVSFPDSVTEIGEDAFRFCTGLSSAFWPAGLRKIGDAAFRACPFTKVDLSDTQLSEVGENAFSECHELRTVAFPGTLKPLPGIASRIPRT